MNDEHVRGGVWLIAQERERQIQTEGWTPEHDRTHDREELAMAAVSYATPLRVRAQVSLAGDATHMPYSWPWDRADWKPNPTHRIRELAKAGALIAAEIDRLAYDEYLKAREAESVREGWDRRAHERPEDRHQGLSDPLG